MRLNVTSCAGPFAGTTVAAIVAAKASGHDYASQPGRLTIPDHVLSPIKLYPWSIAKAHVTKHIGHVVLWEHSMLGNAPD